MVSLITATALLTLIACVHGAEVCYPPCGCFDDMYPFDSRPLPESPASQNIRWVLYTRSNPNVGANIPLGGATPPQYNGARQTKFLIHGWNSSPGTRATMMEIKDVLLDKFDLNAIIVDWQGGADDIVYLPSASNTRVVGACSGEIARQLGTNLANVHCIGHSLGGQTCGYMGAYLGGQMGRISGLDPAGPGFTEANNELRLDSTDARFVDTLNTNAGGSGLGESTGHVNFFPNNGLSQPGCPTGACDHSICKDYFMGSIEFDGTCNFWANPCNSNAAADAGQCETCTPGVNCQKQGYYADTQPGRGRFFLRTNAGYPHCVN